MSKILILYDVKNPFGQPFFELDEVDSSNNYAMQMVQAQLAVHGTTWFAHFQSAGKGQRGKQWNAAPGQNVMVSCIAEPDMLSIDNQFILNASVALACFDFFKQYAIDKTSVKWPNDIYWEDRKAGGVLIENLLQGDNWRFSIIGIGININQTLFPGNIGNAVSLKQITGKEYDVVVLAKQLCDCLEVRWHQIMANRCEELLDEYCGHLYKLNQQAAFKKENTTFNAIVKGVNKKGNLLLQKSNEPITTYDSIEWLLN